MPSRNMGSNGFEPIEIKEETESVFPVSMFLTTSCYTEKKKKKIRNRKDFLKERVSLAQVFEKLPIGEEERTVHFSQYPAGMWVKASL